MDLIKRAKKIPVLGKSEPVVIGNDIANKISDDQKVLVPVIELPSVILAYAYYIALQKNNDSELAHYLQAEHLTDLDAIFGKFNPMLKELARLESAYWDGIEVIRKFSCSDRFGPSGPMPSSARIPDYPFAPFSLPSDYLPSPSDSREQAIARDRAIARGNAAFQAKLQSLSLNH